MTKLQERRPAGRHRRAGAKEARKRTPTTIETKDPKSASRISGSSSKRHDDADKRHLSQEEIAKTYHEVNRLLTADGTAAQQKDKTQLAQQVMEKAANPKMVDQGNYNMWAASLESRTFQQTPSAVQDGSRCRSSTVNTLLPMAPQLKATRSSTRIMAGIMLTRYSKLLP